MEISIDETIRSDKFLYVATVPSNDGLSLVKIGVSRDPIKRLQSLRREYHPAMKLLVIYQHPEVEMMEDALKLTLINYRVHPRKTEYFRIHVDDVIMLIEGQPESLSVGP